MYYELPLKFGDGIEISYPLRNGTKRAIGLTLEDISFDTNGYYALLKVDEEGYKGCMDVSRNEIKGIDSFDCRIKILKWGTRGALVRFSSKRDIKISDRMGHD